MKTDTEIRRHVEEELQWSPDLDATDIAVKVNDSVVTLTGFVPSYHDKFQAENAVKRIAGVTAIANDIQVRLPTSDRKSDPEIARQVVDVIRREFPDQAESLKVVVSQGQLTLEGSLAWQFQREAIERALHRVSGVASITNLIEIRPRVVPREIQLRIENAFRRSAELDAHQITVRAEHGAVTLRGMVRSLAEREEAQRTAWSAPGVTAVINEIVVSP